MQPHIQYTRLQISRRSQHYPSNQHPCYAFSWLFVSLQSVFHIQTPPPLFSTGIASLSFFAVALDAGANDTSLSSAHIYFHAFPTPKNCQTPLGRESETWRAPLQIH